MDEKKFILNLDLVGIPQLLKEEKQVDVTK